jgi:hypothetical protein
MPTHAQKGGVEYSSCYSLPDNRRWVFNTKLRPFYSQEWTGKQCRGNWVDAGSVWMARKISLTQGIVLGTVQLVASLYNGNCINIVKINK